MMLRSLLVVVASLTGGATSALGESGTKKIDPYEVMRSWQLVQDDIARGNMKSFASERKLLAAIARRFRTYDAKVWSRKENIRAAVLLSLSGGPSEVLKMLAREKRVPKEFALIVPGAIAFSARRRKAAWHFLSRVNPREVHPTLAGNIALAKGMLIAGDKPKAAYINMNEARLLAPGMLVEESALRRQVALANAAGFQDDIEHLSRAYVRRFSNSPYLKRFLRVFASAMVTRWKAAPDKDFTHINSVLQMVQQKERHKVLLNIARLGLAAGTHDLAHMASRAVASGPAEENSGIAQRARLYDAAARVFTDDYEEAVSALLNVKSEELSKQDKALRHATLSLARAIRRWPDVKSDGKPPENKEKAEQPITLSQTENKPPKPSAADQAVKDAREAIAGLETLLGEKS